MTSARHAILGAVREALGRGPLAGPPPPALIPKRASGAPEVLVERFVARAQAVSASVARVARPGDVPAAVRDWLDHHHLPRALVVAEGSFPALEAAGLAVRRGPPTADDRVGLETARAAVAETGSVLVAAGPGHPGLLAFLPDNHVVVVHRRDVVGSLDAALDRLRTLCAEGMPSSAVLITGPSRTGDIEQTLQLGAHGPLRLHIVLVDDPS